MNPLFITIASAATEAPHVATEAAGIAALGLDWRALVFQLINFAILLLLLRKFAYGPIVRVLEERRRTITESLENAKHIAATKAALIEQERAVLAAARSEAQAIVAQSKQHGQEIIAAAEAKATEQSAQMVTQAEAKIAQEVAGARQQLRQETLELVALATEKIIDEKLDSTKDVDLIKRAVSAATKS